MSHRTLSYFVRGLPVAAALLLAGCTRELPKKDTYPAQGVVRLHGEPAQYVFVLLQPIDPKKGGGEAQGFTDGNGHFELRTYSNADPDGALPGEYKVVLEENDPARYRSGVSIPPGAKPTPIPSGTMTTEITVEIKSEPNDLDVNVP